MTERALGGGADDRLNRTPLATYRFQFHAGFTFAHALELIPYLADLGISDLYASPIFLATPESTHGYDICGFDQVNPNIGTRDEFRDLAADLKELGMGLLLDMVPNHMGNHQSNCWWQDVLRNGRGSKFAAHFDIDWDARPDRKVLLPVLGDRYGAVLARGELKLKLPDGSAQEREREVHLDYYGKRFPLAPATRAKLVGSAARADVLEEYNRDPLKLHRLIQEQAYRLAFWRIGPHEINYRRFFDVTELVSVRVEDQQVFDDSHQLLFELIAEGSVTGLRIDHPDGLRDPATYFHRLQEKFRSIDRQEGRIFVVAEKILSDEEKLPEDWDLEGTTGYDYLNYLNGIFVAGQNAAAFSEIYSRFTGRAEPYTEVAYEAKRFVLRKLFPAELNALTKRLRRISSQTIAGVDFSTEELQECIIEFIAAFPVYRTYAREGREKLGEAERGYVRDAIRNAIERRAELESALRFLEPLLCFEFEPEYTEELKREAASFVYKLQQLTGPATAKGLEDTAFYRYNRFVSLNEVGGNPGHFGVLLENFHEYNRYKQATWPHSQLASSTHDTKRGEDVRARLNVLSEMPTEWGAEVAVWRAMNEKYKSQEGEPAPSVNDEFLLYQVMLGSWTETDAAAVDQYADRINNYMTKATREAKERTSWTDPNAAYENGTKEFVDRILRSTEFMARFIPFQKSLSFYGVFNSLSQTLIKICSPGVPDFYQGTELWDFSLVDPDNRRPVDYPRRRALLDKIRSECMDANGRKACVKRVLSEPETGEAKLFLTWTALTFRKMNADLFSSGDYRPVFAAGKSADHVISLARSEAAKTIIVVAPRFIRTLMKGARELPVGPAVWGGTKLEFAGKKFRNVITDEELAWPADLGQILASFPVALLEKLS